MIVFSCSASAGQCLLRVVVVIVALVGKKFKIGPKKPDSALVHFITIVGNEKVEKLPLMTFDFRGHLRSLLR